MPAAESPAVLGGGFGGGGDVMGMLAATVAAS